MVWHDVQCEEGSAFQPRARHVVLSEALGQFHWVDTKRTGEGVIVRWRGKQCFTVGAGRTGVVIYNGTEDVILDHWRKTLYHKVVFRIGVAVPWYPALFRRTPDHRWQGLRHLA
ncbi:hypothetical protein [Chondromyces crocatus]|nr:hypothetical protein [Chondromyces crocatus]